MSTFLSAVRDSRRSTRNSRAWGTFRHSQVARIFATPSTVFGSKFLIAGEFPGDGKPKPVAFPDPGEVGVLIDGVRYVNLPGLVELKIASGMTGNLGRMKDLADVIAN